MTQILWLFFNFMHLFLIIGLVFNKQAATEDNAEINSFLNSRIIFKLMFDLTNNSTLI